VEDDRLQCEINLAPKKILRNNPRMKLFYSPTVLNRPSYYTVRTWDELMDEDEDGVFAMEASLHYAILYRGMWFYLHCYIIESIEQTLSTVQWTEKRFYRTKLKIPPIPYEVLDVNADQWVRTPRPLSLSRKLIYALPRWLRRRVFRTKT
jgi:hypothetical protein